MTCSHHFVIEGIYLDLERKEFSLTSRSNQMWTEEVNNKTKSI